jgi:hypothetical protein
VTILASIIIWDWFLAIHEGGFGKVSNMVMLNGAVAESQKKVWKAALILRFWPEVLNIEQGAFPIFLRFEDGLDGHADVDFLGFHPIQIVDKGTVSACDFDNSNESWGVGGGSVKLLVTYRIGVDFSFRRDFRVVGF